MLSQSSLSEMLAGLTPRPWMMPPCEAVPLRVRSEPPGRGLGLPQILLPHIASGGLLAATRGSLGRFAVPKRERRNAWMATYHTNPTR